MRRAARLLATLLGLAVALAVAASAQAYRPPLSVAYPASDQRAWIECVYIVFPFDPFSSRCLVAGTSRYAWLRHTCTGRTGRPDGAWCLTHGYAINNSSRYVRLAIKVAENCAACYGYTSQTYARYF